jgi:hypothetical protein
MTYSNVPGEASELWPVAKKTMEKGKTSLEALSHVGDAIRQITGWDDPVDLFSVHAYIVRSQHEAIMEEKRKRSDESEGPSKRPVKEEKARYEPIPPREEVMEEATPSKSKKLSLKEKGKSPA